MGSILDNARSTGPAVEAMYRFILWSVPTVDKFPRRQKLPLGDRIQATAGSGSCNAERMVVSGHDPPHPGPLPQWGRGG